MRPVEKKQSGDTIQLEDSSTHTISVIYNPYKSAKAVLIINIGRFCSYCEDAYHQDRDLHVEHVQPKGLSQYADLEFVWTNFLLGCATCNGADNKGDKDVLLSQINLPHRNNTFISLKYMPGGVVTVNPNLSGRAYAHALALLELVGLNKSPMESKPGDTRWRKRKKDWDLAELYLLKFEANCCDVDTIIELVLARGGWSIWFTIFRGHDSVRKALIEKIPGTCISCFDAQNHYEPIGRNLGSVDPV